MNRREQKHLGTGQKENPVESIKLEPDNPSHNVQPESDQGEKQSENIQTEPSQGDGVTENVLLEPETKQEEVVFEKIAEGSIDGQVSCVEGPVSNATVSIGMISSYTDSKGNFLLEHVPPGIAKIRARSPTSRFYDTTLDVLVETDKRNNLFIFLTEVTGTVEGSITDEDGKPLAGAEVSGLFRLGKEALVARSDENGHYFFADVPRGSYYVRARALGHMIEGATVNVIGGSTTQTNFTLQPASLSISGKVVSNEGISC